MERVGLLYDMHWPYHDVFAYGAAVTHLKNLKPKINRLVLGGDAVDFYKISFWKSDPERMPFKQEVMADRRLLKDLRSIFPRIPIDYLEGNHEQRLFRHTLEKVPDLAWNNKIEDVLHLGARNINYISNIERMAKGLEPYKLGKLYVLHGHEKKVSYGAINLARLFYLKCKDNVIAGHHHRPDKSLVRTISGQFEAAFTVGTLGQLSEQYQPINDWCHGFAYVDVEECGDFNVHNRVIINGKVREF